MYSIVLRTKSKTKPKLTTMTKEQASNLGRALISWSKGAALQARDARGPDKAWYSFTPEDYEKINVEEGIEWQAVDQVGKSKIFPGAASAPRDFS
jgi:hypothetical protein